MKGNINQVNIGKAAHVIVKLNKQTNTAMGLLEASTSLLATRVCGYHKHKFSKGEKFFFINNDKIMIIFVIYIAEFITIMYNNVRKNS